MRRVRLLIARGCSAKPGHRAQPRTSLPMSVRSERLPEDPLQPVEDCLGPVGQLLEVLTGREGD